MSRVERLRLRIAEANLRIAGQQANLGELAACGAPTKLAWDLLQRLTEMRDTYCDCLSSAEQVERAEPNAKAGSC